VNRRIAALALSLLLPLPCALRAGEPSLEKLRKELAQRYVEPGPHMALARYSHDKGNPLQAFLLLEYARRGLFPREQFDEAFESTFLRHGPFDNSKKAETALLKKHAEQPRSAEVVVKLADIYISRNDWPRAKEYLAEAMKLTPEDFTNVEALAEVLRREGKPEEGEKVVKGYLDKHPQSREAYRRKIEPLMRKDPASARKLLEEALQKFPKEGGFLFNKGVLFQDEGKLKEAEEHYVRAAALAKDSPHVQGWTGRFFLKVKQNEARALGYYLSVYFLDPHFYDTEYAEQRIGKISSELAQKKYEGLIKAGKKPAEVLGDENPIVVGMALDGMWKKWDGKYAKPVVASLGHDDEHVRGKALRALLANVDRSFDKDLKALLADGDLRKKGMAGYLAVKLWGKEGIKEVKPWLKEDAQLLRYDAISALLQHGGEEGRAIVRAHRAHEKHPWFKKWLEALDKEK
jgi:Tfp pilus assembly protein PilF